MKKRLVTSALPYVNNIPHLGNLIQVLSADVFARFCRVRGYETLYICGSDEYGTATETRALQEKIHPRELCERFYRIHKDIYDWFAIEFDHFGRTSCPQQTAIVQQIYREVKANGFIERREIAQTFCTSCDRFLADRYVQGSCPHCGGSNARGDQCEDCGSMLDPTDLLQPRCSICGQAPQQRKTEHLFIDLPALKDRLETWIDEASERGRWAKNALQMTRSWIRDGLKQRCITRDLSWGVPVPEMPGKVFYVWFDAPIGYISLTADFLEQQISREQEDQETWQDWWQNPAEVELFQFIGKDNIPFHTVLFPSTQLASASEWTMLHHMSSSEYLNYESGKFSKTRGVGIFGNDCQNTGIPADCWRFYLFYNRPEKSDYEFTWTGFQQLINRELIGNLGNLVHRTLSFLQRFFGGRLLPHTQVCQVPEISDFLHSLELYQSRITENLEWSQIKDALHQIMEMAACGNKAFQKNEPWALVKKDPDLAHRWISALAFLIHDLAICLCPYVPQMAERIADFLALPQDFGWEQLRAYGRLSCEVLPKPELLFQQLEDERISELREHFSGDQARNQAGDQAAVQKKASPMERFVQNTELKVGKIVEISRHPNAERLFVETIDCGEEEPRTIVSGLAEHYRPEELLGKNVAVVANLKAAKLRGIKSMGMILAASKGEELEVLHPVGQPGDRIVISGFEELEPPQKRIRTDDFFAVSLVLRNGTAYLAEEARPLLVLTQEGKQELRSERLQDATIA